MKKFLLSIFAVLFAFAGVHAQSYVKVTSTPADWSGDYLIVYEAGNVAFNGGLSTLDVASNTISVTISDGKILATDATNAAKFTINSNGNIKSASGYYIGQTSNANGLKSSTSTTYANTLSMNNDGSVNFVSGGAYLRYNAAKDQLRFRYYKSSSYTGQKAIALYKYVDAEGGETQEPEVGLPAVSVDDKSTIALGDGIILVPVEDNTVTYCVNNGASIQITETTTITADKAGVMTLSIASTCNNETLTAEYTYYVKPAMPAMTDAVGFEESLDVEIEGEGEIYYTLNGDDPTTESDIYDGAITITETTTVKAIAVVDGVESDIVSVTYAKLQAATPGYTIDVLTCGVTGVSGTTYTDWEGITLNSTAVYAGQSAGEDATIQLRSKNSNSGIITTASGGKAVKVVVTWSSKTMDGRTLDIYGKNSAYESPTDLYASDKGTKLGSIVCGTSTELVIDGDYKYIGIRSNSGALYLDDIEITWANPYKLKVSEVGYATMFLGFDAAIPTIEGDENGVFTATESEAVGYVHLNSVEGVLPAETGVIVKAAAGTYEFWPSTGATADVTGNLLEGTVAATEIEEEAYVLGKVDGVVGLYKAEMAGGVWLNNANKAYLPASVASGAASYSFRFEEGTTGIENVEVENASNVIYDLTGRKVNEITAPGIYIVNGVKRVVR